MKNKSIKLYQYLLGLGLSALVVSAAPEVMGRTPKVSSFRQASLKAELSVSAKSEILDAHNQYRSAVNAPALEWSSELEQDARQWAQYLASFRGKKLFHASYEDRKGKGENLWMGQAGYFSPTTMVRGWGKGSQYFRAGTFPDVSTTGDWANVGHYTQIVWKTTTKVGCAQSRAGQNDVLVCRYDPAGNIAGREVY